MGAIVTEGERPAGAPVRCPICAQPNDAHRLCRHVRWTFDQGGPLDFAHYALETSPYVSARGHKPTEIPKVWWQRKAEWIVDMVMLHFDAVDGFVFGEIGDLDLLARDVWKEFHPDPELPRFERIDPI